MERVEMESNGCEIEYGIKHPNMYQRKRVAADAEEREETNHGFTKQYGSSKPAGWCH